MSRRTARVVGGIGRTLIGSGVLILLFVAYQLWGTGFQQARSQDRLTDQFEALLEATAQAREQPATTPTTTPRGTAEPAVEEPEPEAIDPELLAALAPVLGEPLGRIEIPAIGLDVVMVHGVRVPDLRLGPGHFPGTPLPGQPGNSSIAGHRTTYGQPFHDLDKLQPGDEIVVTTLQGAFTYEVMAHPGDGGEERGHFIVRPEAVEVLDDYGDNRLTLVACHPKFSARQRIIVTALLVEEPVEPPPPAVDPEPEPVSDPGEPAEAAVLVQPEPPEDFGEGLSGDTDALLPAVLWGAVFALLFLATWAAGRAWRRWPAYVVGTPLLAITLYSCFVYLDQFLPSY